MKYNELVAAARAYADRNDLEVIDNIDNFIILAESRINRLLKTRKQSTRAFTPTVEGQEYYSLPPDYAGMRDIQLNSDMPDQEHSTTPFTYITPTEMNSRRNAAPGSTLLYTVIGDQFHIFPKQSAGKTIEITYFQKVPNLNVGADENWLSIDHPDIYLAGITAEIELFAKNYSVADGWVDRMATAIAELEHADIKERWTSAPLTIRVG